VLAGTLLENHLHQFFQEGRRVAEFSQQLVGNHIEIRV
jgi:hypothetical protein